MRGSEQFGHLGTVPACGRSGAAPALAALHVAVEGLATAAGALADTGRRGEEQANANAELARGVAGAEAANADMQGQLDTSEAEAGADSRAQSRAVQGGGGVSDGVSGGARDHARPNGGHRAGATQRVGRPGPRARR